MWDAGIYGCKWVGSGNGFGDAKFPEDVKGLVGVALIKGDLVETL